MLSLEEISAYIEIQQVLARYMHGLDRLDKLLIQSTYHPDATDERAGVIRTAQELAAWATTTNEFYGFGQHHVTTCYIELHGNWAAVESYVLGFRPMKHEKISGIELLNAGVRMLDRFEQRDGAWKVAKRRLVMDWSRRNLPGEPWMRQESFYQPGRAEEDPSHELFANGLKS